MSRRDRERQISANDVSLPVVSLIGRPNVGKSSLFNRLVGGRPALVEDMPGVTRDRRYGACEWMGTRFRVVDTGGLDPSADGILGAMRAQTLRAVDEAQVLVFVVDVKEGITPVDDEVARLLRKTGKPVLVAANKVDSQSREPALSEVYALGFEHVFGLSATHGRGVGDLLDEVTKLVRPHLPPPGEVTDESTASEEPGVMSSSHPETPAPEPALVEAVAADELTVDQVFGDEGTDEKESAGAVPVAADALSATIRLAFVGKPNAGKSSLVNRLLGEERVLVHDQPGTTRDPIDTPFRFGDRDFVLVDTAGLRRRRTIETLTEAVAAKMARDQVARADVAALVIDAQIGATAEDQRLASLIEESGRAAIIILNKGDLIRRSDLDERVAATKETLGFMSWAPFLVTSTVTARGVSDIPVAAASAFDEWSRRVPTADLNKHFEEMVLRRPPPAGPAGRHVRLFYATQAAVRPPTFYVSANHGTDVGLPYRRYLTNQFRKIYGFEGSPLRVVVRGRKKKKLGDSDN